MQNPPPGPPPGGQPPGYPPQGGQPPNYPPPGGQPPGYPPQGGQQPGYPPPGYGQGYQQPGYQQGYPPGSQPAAAGGVDKKTGAILSYVLTWVTGIVFLFVGKNDPDVKYHAAQSVVFFGGTTVIFWVLRILVGVMPGAIGLLLGLVEFALGIFVFVVWIMCLVRAASGNGARFQVPLVGNLVEQYADQLASAVQ